MIKKLFVMLVLISALLCFFACSDENDEDGTSTPANIVLISEGKANFRIVFSSDAGANAISKVDGFVKCLRSLGVEIEDPVRASLGETDAEYEILVGPGITNRGEEYVINEKTYGEEGYCIKTIDKKIIIVGGSRASTSDAFEYFTETVLGISEETESVSALTLSEEPFYEKMTDHAIESVTVGGVDLAEFVLVRDVSGMEKEYGSAFITDFRSLLYSKTGYWLEIIDQGELTDKVHKIVVRYTSEPIEGDTEGMGFVTKVDGGDLIFESNYANAMITYFKKVTDELIFSAGENVSIPENYSKFEPASIVLYDDFGAKGDGETDDFVAIYAAHVYANECGQTVMGRKGATYYVGDSFTTSIPVMTNVDLHGSTILINDDSAIAFANRGKALFNVYREQKYTQVISGFALDDMFKDHEKKISRDAKSLPWLVPYLKGESFVLVTNNNHVDFIRYGANQSSGEARKDLFLVDIDGNILDGYAAAFEFDDITSVEIFETSEKEIEIKNGTIKNITCRVRAETDFKNKYAAFLRGINIQRCNVYIHDMNFRTANEPTIDYTDDPNDSLCKNYGRRSESYPYSGFIAGHKSYNILVENCTMSARTVYYEDKPATESTGGKVPDPVPMGSYGYTYTLSANVRHENVDQYSKTGIGDSRYWGIMSSNTCKNFVFNECRVNRFDAHRGFWNARLTNSTFGHTINVTGGGELYIENVEKICGSSFISLRGDYGSSFDGNVTIKDSTHLAINSYDSLKGGYYNVNSVITGNTYLISSGFSTAELYLKWDFGYDCTLPHTVTIDNFKTNSSRAYVFSNVSNTAFENKYKNQYGLPSEIIFKNMESTLPTCRSSSCSILRSVKVTVE